MKYLDMNKPLLQFTSLGKKHSLIFAIYLILTLCVFVIFLIDVRPIPVPIIFFFTLIFCFPTGYAAFLPFNSIKSHPLFVRLPIYLSVGYVLNNFWSFFLSPFTIQPHVTLTLVLIATLVILFYLINTRNQIKKNQKETRKQILKSTFLSLNFGNNPSKHIWNILFFCVFVAFALFILFKFQGFGWPFYHDVMGHSAFTSLQIFGDGLTIQFPLATQSQFYYPLGMHFFAANLSVFFDNSPPLVFLAIGAITIFLITTIIASITYVLTKSLWLSLIVILASLNIHSSWVHFSYLWGMILQGGAYTMLTGFLFIFLLILVLLVIREKRNTSYLVFIILLVAAGAIIYPTTLIYSAIIITSFLISGFSKKGIKDIFSERDFSIRSINKQTLLQINIFFVIIFFIGISNGKIISYIKSIVFKQISSAENPDFINPINEMSYVTVANGLINISHFFNDNLFNIAIMVGVIGSVYLIIYHRKYRFFGFVNLAFILLFLTEMPILFLEVLTSPARYGALLPILSWITFSIIIYEFCKKKTLNDGSVDIKDSINYHKVNSLKHHKSNFLKFFRNQKGRNTQKILIISGFAFLTIILVFPDVVKYQVLAEEESNFIAHMEPFMGSINWIAKNIEPNDLILDFSDGYHPGASPYVWLQGIRYQILVNGQSQIPNGLDKLQQFQVNSAFKSFKNENRLDCVLSENNVNYIWTSVSEIRDKGLQNYDFLEQVYKDDNLVIYKYFSQKSSLITNKQLDKQSDENAGILCFEKYEEDGTAEVLKEVEILPPTKLEMVNILKKQVAEWEDIGALNKAFETYVHIIGIDKFNENHWKKIISLLEKSGRHDEANSWKQMMEKVFNGNPTD